MLLTEEALGSDDAGYLRTLHNEDDLEYHLLVPADTDRSLLVSVVDGLAVGDLKETLDEVRQGHHTPDGPARVDAAEALRASLQVLQDVGVTAEGVVTADDPVPALREAVARHGADEVQIVTRPHVLEESFHRDWGSRARHELGLPVLHVYAHSGGWMP
ncbi:MAG: hypothetical protein ACRDYU_15335 [Actinomycetes bacterium]